jgi:apolipoprotein N-acyltransferase
LIKNLHHYYDTNDVPFADYTLLPELVINLNNQQPEKNSEILEIRELIHKRGGSENFILGANLTAWKNQQVIGISINEDTLQKRYKEMLVPFGEKIPYPELMEPIIGLVYKNRIFPYISPQKGSGLFTNKGDIFHVSLCYESFFENFLKQHLNHSAQVIFVVAREPFQFNTHYKNISLLMSRIQAITFQKYLVRSSWCGVSCIINTKGEVQQMEYDKNDVIDAKIFLNDKPSFFSNTKYNYLFILAVFIFFVTLLLPIFSRIVHKKGL